MGDMEDVVGWCSLLSRRGDGHPFVVDADGQRSLQFDGVTIQSQILYEVQKLARETGTAVIWITHDLAVVAELADRIAVMYAGRIVETGPVDLVLDAPRHPYTQGLLGSSATLVAPGGRLNQIEGMAPRIDSRPSGCPFRPRCPRSLPVCAEIDPPPTFDGARQFRCHNPAQPMVTTP